MSYLYNPLSECADEFINHDEILSTLKFAEENKNNISLCREILDIARAHAHISNTGISDHPATLTHRQACVLLA